MNPDRTDLNDLAAIARTTRSPHYRRALATAASEIEHLRTACSNYKHHEQGLLEELSLLRAQLKELEANADWHIDMVLGDAWLCRIEGKYEDICDLLGEAVGKQIQSFEIDTSHHESTDNA
jgi:hypothetical protein